MQSDISLTANSAKAYAENIEKASKVMKLIHGQQSV
jgi:hypothetical protein